MDKENHDFNGKSGNKKEKIQAIKNMELATIIFRSIFFCFFVIKASSRSAVSKWFLEDTIRVQLF